MNVEDLNKKGDDLCNERKNNEALLYYNRALDIEPSFIPSLLGKGTVLRRLNNYEESLVIFNKVIEINPNLTRAWNNKGIVLRKRKRYDEALIAFNKAIDIDPNSARVWNNKGLVLRNLKKYNEALKAFEKSINTDPEDAFSWNGKGLVLLSLQKYDEAIEAYNKAIEVYNIPLDRNSFVNKPNKNVIVFSWNGKGIAYANLRNFDKAIEAFNEAIKLDTRPAFSLSGKATVFYSIGKLNTALKLLEESFEFNPESSFAWNEKGLVLLHLKKFGTAVESFEKSISCDTGFIPAYNNLAELYLGIGDLKKASSILDEAFYKDANNDTTLMLKGKIELENQNYDNAIYYFKEAVSQNSRNPLYLFWEVYAKYLKAEVSFGSDSKRYQDILLSCIRELEKINTFNFSNKEIKYFSSTKKQVRIIIESSLRKIQSLLLKSKYNSRISIKLLSKIHTTLLKYDNLRVKAYNKYFIGCFYYKLNDYFTAKSELSRCIKLSSEPKITNSAKQLVDDIWDYKLNTPVCKWWLYSPRHSLRRKITFFVLLFSIFGVLLPEFSYFFTVFLYTSMSKLLLHIPLIYELFTSYLSLIFISILTSLSFVDWTNNTTQYALLTLLLFFFLIYPCIKSLKGSEVEIEMQSPQPFELTPGLIEKNLKDLERYLQL